MRLIVLLGVFFAATLALPAAAQPGPGPGPGMGGPSLRDCGRARNPRHCREQQARAGCAGLRGSEHRQCLRDRMPPENCRKARYPERCALHQSAYVACRAEVGPAFRDCMRHHLGRRR